MREQDGPAIANPFVKVDRTLRSFGGEIGGFVVYAQHRFSPRLALFEAGRLGPFAPIILAARRVPTGISDWELRSAHFTLPSHSTQRICDRDPPTPVRHTEIGRTQSAKAC